jgi:hypothetical protein
VIKDPRHELHRPKVNFNRSGILRFRPKIVVRTVLVHADHDVALTQQI